jgi:hypothetical protein
MGRFKTVPDTFSLLGRFKTVPTPFLSDLNVVITLQPR